MNFTDVIEQLGQHLRFSIRSLRRTPGSLIGIIAMLAFAIGAATVVFQSAVSVAMHPVPFPNPDELVVITESVSKSDDTRAGQRYASYGTYADMKERVSQFADVAVYDAVQKSSYVVLTGMGEPERLVSVQASASLFRLLGVHPIVGRFFAGNEELANGEPVAIISENLWRKRFAGQRDVVGRTINLNQTVFTVIGVVPSTLGHAPFFADVWTPFRARPGWRESRLSMPFRVVARVAPGVSLDEARSAAIRAYEQAASAHPEMADFRLAVNPLADMVVGKVWLYVVVLSIAVGCVFLVACANTANILLARAASRVPEFAVRISMGASYRKLYGLFVTDSLILSLAAGLFGVVSTYVTSRSIQALAPAEIRQALSGTAVGLGRTGGTEALLFVFVLVLITTAFCSIAPAVLFARTKDLHVGLKESGPGVIALRYRRIQRGLAVAQIGFGLVLSVVTLMLLGSYSAITGQSTGFDPEKTVTFQVAVRGTPLCGCTRLSEQSEFYTGLLQGLSRLPGVLSIGAVSDLPLLDSPAHVEFQVEGSGDRSLPLVGVRSITPSYLRAIRVPLVAGRAFDERDTLKSEEVAIINQAMARYFGDPAKAPGQRFRFNPRSNGPWIRVVGVAIDMKQVALEADAEPEVFLPHTQAPSSLMRIVVRTNEESATIVPALRKAVARHDPYIPLADIQPMSSILSEAVAGRRFTVLVLASLSLLVLTLAIIGVYGVQSFTVARKRREIGLRLALGATRNDIVLWILADGTKLAVVGIMAGGLGFALLMDAIRPLLYGISLYDPRYGVAAASVMLLSVWAGSYFPARLAACVDPNDALRHE